jgi:hypothetical protein
MRWQDERYVRFYTRNTPEWCVLPWQARGLMGLLLREVDRAGILELGKLGLRAVAVAVRAPWEEVEAPLGKLLEDGMVVYREDLRLLVIPNFVEAQEANQSDKARKRTERERARDLARAKSLGVTAASQSVTAPSDIPESRDQKSHPVTSSHSVLCRAVPSRAELDTGQPVQPESGYDLAWRVWRELWAARYGEPFQRTVDSGPKGDDRTLQRVGALALEHGDRAEAVLRLKLEQYFANDKPWLVRNRHPTRTFETDWNQYGNAPPAEQLATDDNDDDEHEPTNGALTPEQITQRHRLLDEAQAKSKAARADRARISAELERNLKSIGAKS